MKTTQPDFQFRHAVLLALPVVLYLAALNPYFLPACYDNLVFHEGARSIAQTGEYRFNGMHVGDWGPGLPLLLAIPMVLGWQSVVASKLVILFCVALGLGLVHATLHREQRTQPLLTCFIFALLPSAFLMGTRVMTEWPYIALSFGFFGLLHRLRRQRRFELALLCGLVLGAASLTRFIGVVLGAALIAQAVAQLRSSGAGQRMRAVLPEALASAVGAAMFLAWWARNARLSEQGTAASDYHPEGWVLDFFSEFGLTTIPGKISDLLFHSDSLGRTLGLPAGLALLIFAVPGLLVLGSLVARLRSSEHSPTDWCVLAHLGIFFFLGHNQQTRYLVPIAPFLIVYFFDGLGWMARACRIEDAGWRLRLGRVGTAAWLALFLAGAGHLLVRGNASGTHAGLSPLVSRTAQSFYLGPWRDLHDAGERLRRDPLTGNVAFRGGAMRYVVAFSGRMVTGIPSAGPAAHVLTASATPLSDAELAALGVEEVASWPEWILYRAAGEQLTSEGLPATEQLWIANAKGNDLDVYEVGSWRRLGGLVVGPNPHGLAAAADGSVVYVSLERLGEASGELLAIDPRTFEIQRRITVCPGPHEIECTPDGRFVYVPCADERWQVFDAATFELVVEIPVEGRPHNTTISPDGRFMFLSPLGQGNEVVIVDIGAGHRVVGTIPFSDAPRPAAISSDGKRLYQNIDGLVGFEVADIAERRVVSSVAHELRESDRDTPSRSHGLAIRPDQAEIWSSNFGHHRVHVHELASGTHAEIAAIDFDSTPYWISFSVDGRHAFVSLTRHFVWEKRIARVSLLLLGLGVLGLLVGRGRRARTVLVVCCACFLGLGLALYVRVKTEGSVVAVIDTASKQVVTQLEVGRDPKRTLAVTVR